VRFQGRYGVSPGGGGNDYNNPAANGNGVGVRWMGRGEGYTPRMPRRWTRPRQGWPVFDTHNITAENIAQPGSGPARSLRRPRDDLRATRAAS